MYVQIVHVNSENYSWDTVIICCGLIYVVNPWMYNTEPYSWQAIPIPALAKKEGVLFCCVCDLFL